ncbi:unnamed protein product [Vicia faba]|uniref:Uncharacterized protein n=1 Tax=Vicia faba TaxID=3906 RepID=A0AAV1A809_VICFA|nr:unnamed protein product [Vicia faba]
MIDNCEPNDAEMEAHLDLQAQSDVIEYNIVDSKIEGTSAAQSIEVAIDMAGIMVKVHWKSLLQEAEAHVEVLKTLQDEVVDLKRALLTPNWVSISSGLWMINCLPVSDSGWWSDVDDVL